MDGHLPQARRTANHRAPGGSLQALLLLSNTLPCTEPLDRNLARQPESGLPPVLLVRGTMQQRENGQSSTLVGGGTRPGQRQRVGSIVKAAGAPATTATRRPNKALDACVWWRLPPNSASQ